MGIGISFNVDLKGSWSYENYKYILGQGIKFGFQYYDIVTDQEIKSLDDAVDTLLTINKYDTYAIIGKIQDHIVTIVASSDKTLGIIIGDFYDIDVVHYMKIFVDMIRDFAILDIQIFID